MTPEGQVVAAILEYLQLRGVFAFRMNTGAMVVKVPNGRDRFLRFGKKGLSDIIGILDDGRWLAIECKTAKGRASEAQLSFLAEIAKRGGVAFIARSVEDVNEHLFQPGYGVEINRKYAQERAAKRLSPERG